MLQIRVRCFVHTRLFVCLLFNPCMSSLLATGKQTPYFPHAGLRYPVSSCSIPLLLTFHGHLQGEVLRVPSLVCAFICETGGQWNRPPSSQPASPGPRGGSLPQPGGGYQVLQLAKLVFKSLVLAFWEWREGGREAARSAHTRLRKG